MKKVALLLASAGLMTACHPDNPPLSAVTKPVQPAAVEKPGPLNFEKTFGYFKSEATAEQQKHNENTISAFFSAKQSNGQALEGLTPNDLTVTENRLNVTPFKVETVERSEEQQQVDIALVVDITGTMEELIAEAKGRLTDFVEDPKAKNLNIRICVATFGDRTVKPCNRFYEINRGSGGEAQRQGFLRELRGVNAFKGQGRDPGWPDYDENPMGALVDVSKAPWGAKAQRFVILMTDWGFLYSPDNQGTIGSNAPTMKQVGDAIRKENLKIYAITRTELTHQRNPKLDKNCTWVDQAARQQHCVWNGFNNEFQGQPSIIDANANNKGQHFNFDKVLNKEIKFSSILDEIVRHVSITYKLSYVVEQVQGLDPTLPTSGRDVQISLRDPNRGALTKPTVQSSVPTGRPQYKQAFTVADSPVARDSVKVTVNDLPVNPSEYDVNGSEIRFKATPPPGAKLKFEYYFENPNLNLRLEPIRMHGGLNSNNTRVWINDIEARQGDMVFQPDLSGHTDVGFNDSTVMAANDPYQIRAKKELKVKIVSNAAP